MDIIPGVLALAGYKASNLSHKAGGKARTAILLLSVTGMAFSLNATHAHAAGQAQSRLSADELLARAIAVGDVRGTNVSPLSLYTAHDASTETAENFLDRELSADPVGGPALITTTRAEDERRRDQQKWHQTLGVATDESTETLANGVRDAFFSGSSFAYNIYADVRRMYDNAPEPEFDAQSYTLKSQKINQIDDQQLAAFSRTSSIGEWNDLLTDVRERAETRKRIARMGSAAQIAASVVARLPDLLILGMFVVAANRLFAKRKRNKQAALAVQNHGA